MIWTALNTHPRFIGDVLRLSPGPLWRTAYWIDILCETTNSKVFGPSDKFGTKWNTLNWCFYCKKCQFVAAWLCRPVSYSVSKVCLIISQHLSAVQTLFQLIPRLTLNLLKKTIGWGGPLFKPLYIIQHCNYTVWPLCQIGFKTWGSSWELACFLTCPLLTENCSPSTIMEDLPFPQMHREETRREEV